MPLTNTALDEAVRWGVPALLTFIGGVWLKKSARFRAWRDAGRAHKSALGSMASSWATFSADVKQNMADLREGHSRVTTQMRALDEKLEAQLNAQNVVLSRLMAMTLGQFEMSPVASFICDAEGRYLNVNSAYAKELGVGRDDLLDFRYRRYIPSIVLAPYLARFTAAAEDHREFEDEIAMSRADRTQVRMRVHMIPHPRDGEAGAITHWVGTLVVLPDKAP